MKRFFLALALFAPLSAFTQQTGAREKQLIELEVKSSALKSPVTVRRDRRGIPYIEARNEEDLYFAQGFVTAQDRLWQMDLFRRSARGELSEIFGRAALDEDKRHRTYGFAQVVEGMYANADATQRQMLDAYAQGVNAYIASLNEQTLPIEFKILRYKPREWRPTDSLLLLALFAEQLSTTWQLDLMRAALRDMPEAKRRALMPDKSTLDVIVVGSDRAALKAKSEDQTSALREVKDRKLKRQKTLNNQTSTLPPVSASALEELARIQETTARTLERIGFEAEDRAASNNWVVSGKRTASGHPLLANDPHLSASAPSIWYMVHLSAPGVRVAGVTAPGLPGVTIGHNERIAWGFTNLGPDVQDLYLERFDGQNPRMYRTPAGMREAEVRHEEIKVRKSPASTETETIPFDVTITRHGPIVFEKDGARYALKWTMLDATRSAEAVSALYLLNRARNWNEFRAALSHFKAPATQNVVYADADGHIGYYGAGLIPIRKTGDGSAPYDGATDEGEWGGYIPFDELPHSFDPSSGIIVTANGRVVGDSYKHFLTHEWAQPYRARRIYDLLNAKPKLTADDFQTIQADTYSIAGVTFAREAAKLLEGYAGSDEKLRAAAALMRDWDGRVNADSRAALLVAQTRAAFRQRILDAAIGSAQAQNFFFPMFDVTLNEIIARRPPEWLPKEFTANDKGYPALVAACVGDARAQLTKRLGADETKWWWGALVQVRFPHPLAAVPFIGQQFLIPPFPQNGSGGGGVGPTPNVGANVSMRFIADPLDWDATRHGITLGESGDPQNAHWKDQLDDWRNVAPQTFPFSENAVKQAAKETLTLAPSK